MAAAFSVCEMRDTIRTGLVRASGGKSHSWLTPATCSPSPSANRISVAEGSKEQIFMACNLSRLGGLRSLSSNILRKRDGANITAVFFLRSTAFALHSNGLEYTFLHNFV